MKTTKNLAIPLAYTDDSVDTLASQLYHTYAESSDFKNFIGNPMPSWENLPRKQQDHWCHVAHTVLHTCRTNSHNRDLTIPEIANIGKCRNTGEPKSTRYLGAIITASKEDYYACLEHFQTTAPNIFVGFELKHFRSVNDMRGHKPRLMILTARAIARNQIEYQKLSVYGRGHIPYPVWVLNGYYEKILTANTSNAAEKIPTVLFQEA